MKKCLVIACAFALLIVGCTKQEEGPSAKAPITPGAKSVSKDVFGQVDGKDIDIYTLINSNGVKARIMTWGAAVVNLEVPDKDGKLGDVVLGFDKLQYDEGKKNGYLHADNPYFGCIVGRYGNRIAKGKFSIDGTEYTLAVNNGENHLHGGLKGFDKKIWDAEVVSDGKNPAVKFSYTSPDMEEGYPGELKCSVIYTLTEENELKLVYEATTNKPTVCNLTHHGYFNLAGPGNGDILGHLMEINADNITPVDKGLIPTGVFMPVEGTPFDFRKAKPIGQDITSDHEQIKFGGGYDHNWVLNKAKEGELSLAARVTEEATGRVMEVWTTEPGVQFYCGNFLDGTLTGKEGKVYPYRGGLCLETQHYPDSPNKPQWPSVLLKPGETYGHTCIYKFTTK